ncbi:MAG: DUF6569 family protein [Candidatus Acidiferrales bacterium]
MKFNSWSKQVVTIFAAAAILGAPSVFGNFSGGNFSGGNFSGSAGGGSQTWRIGEPVRYENMTIFPLIAKSGADTSVFETLDEGLASGEVLVTEHGNEYLRRARDGSTAPSPAYNSGAAVNQLVLINRGKKPVLLLAGEVVAGGNQDRIVGKDRIVPVGGEPLPLDVFCVEHGRWTGESTKFGAAKMMVHPSVREKAAVQADQVQVWNAVNRGSTQTVMANAAPSVAAGGAGNSAAGGVAGGTASRAAAPEPVVSPGRINSAIATVAPTNSYRKIYQSAQIAQPVEEFANEMSRRFARATEGLKGEGVIGVIVAYGGEVAWSDAFASSALFRQYWSKLLRSYVVEALARPATKEQASLEDARSFLERAKGHEREESEPGVYVWRERTQGQYSEIELESLAPETLMLHWMKVLRTN